MKYKLIPTMEIWEETIKELKALGWLQCVANHWNIKDMWHNHKENTAIRWTDTWSLFDKKYIEFLE